VILYVFAPLAVQFSHFEVMTVPLVCVYVCVMLVFTIADKQHQLYVD
jgi:hypothetical protein